jgi:hypothetical protein
MTDTTNLGLPCIEGSQAQKHVTHNDALRILDALVQLAVLDRDLTAPPSSPTEGQRWIVKTGASGAWAGHDHAVGAWQDGGWQFSAPQAGWLAFVVDEGALVIWDGAAWSDLFSVIGSIQNLVHLGVGTTADATNPLSAKLNNALFAAKTVAEGGDGNLRYKLSKESAAKTLSFLFQDNFSGRAEIGLTGDDDFHFKVSPDGSSWIEGIKVACSDGSVTPKSLRHYDSGQPSFSFLPVTYEGTGGVETYRCDETCGQHPRTATISSVSGDTITLTAAVAGQFYNTGMVNVAWVRIWNVSKSPNQPAWVKAIPANNQLQVIDAAAIATWTNAETIQIGDDGTPAAPALRVFTLDISPIMVRKFGAAFRQAAVILSVNIVTGSAGDIINFTPTGASGTATRLPGGIQVAGVGAPGGTAIVSCSELSPVSNSNLLKLQEAFSSTAGTRLVRISGMFA